MQINRDELNNNYKYNSLRVYLLQKIQLLSNIRANPTIRNFDKKINFCVLQYRNYFLIK